MLTASLVAVMLGPLSPVACRNPQAAGYLAEAALPMVEHLEPWTRAGIEADATLQDSEKADLRLELDVLLELLRDQLKEAAEDEPPPQGEEQAAAGAVLILEKAVLADGLQLAAATGYGEQPKAPAELRGTLAFVHQSTEVPHGGLVELRAPPEAAKPLFN